MELVVSQVFCITLVFILLSGCCLADVASNNTEKTDENRAKQDVVMENELHELKNHARDSRVARSSKFNFLDWPTYGGNELPPEFYPGEKDLDTHNDEENTDDVSDDEGSDENSKSRSKAVNITKEFHEAAENVLELMVRIAEQPEKWDKINRQLLDLKRWEDLNQDFVEKKNDNDWEDFEKSRKKQKPREGKNNKKKQRHKNKNVSNKTQISDSSLEDERENRLKELAKAGILFPTNIESKQKEKEEGKSKNRKPKQEKSNNKTKQGKPRKNKNKPLEKPFTTTTVTTTARTTVTEPTTFSLNWKNLNVRPTSPFSSPRDILQSFRTFHAGPTRIPARERDYGQKNWNEYSHRMFKQNPEDSTPYPTAHPPIYKAPNKAIKHVGNDRTLFGTLTRQVPNKPSTMAPLDYVRNMPVNVKEPADYSGKLRGKSVSKWDNITLNSLKQGALLSRDEMLQRLLENRQMAGFDFRRQPLRNKSVEADDEYSRWRQHFYRSRPPPPPPLSYRRVGPYLAVGRKDPFEEQLVSMAASERKLPWSHARHLNKMQEQFKSLSAMEEQLRYHTQEKQRLRQILRDSSRTSY